MNFVFEAIGLVGALFIASMYWFDAAKPEHLSRKLFYSMNALGAALILISLIINFNLGAFTIEIFWLIISLYGIFKAQK